MAVIKGMGPCAIPQDNGLPCGRQINEGEPVGTIAKGSAFNPLPMVGHKRCADAYYQRVQAAEREKNLAMVQRINQAGAGGPVDNSTAFDPVQGSIPLEKPEAPATPVAPGQIIGDMSQGAQFLGDLPEDASPADAVRYAQGEPIQTPEKPAPSLPNYVGPQSASPQPQAQMVTDPNLPQLPPGVEMPTREEMATMLPTLDAWKGKVVIAMPGPMTKVDPSDAEDFIELLKVQIARAKRQQLSRS